MKGYLVKYKNSRESTAHTLLQYSFVGAIAGIGTFLSSGRYGERYGELKKIEPVKSNSVYCPSGMIVIPAGHFVPGNVGGTSYKDRKFSSEIVGVASMAMDKDPVSVGQYDEFLEFAENNPNGFATAFAKDVLDDDDENDDEDDEDDDEDDEKVIVNKKKKDRVIIFEGVEVSPDRSAWTKIALDSDSGLYKFLDIMANEYFDIAAYKQFPVVCVNFDAANLFAKWRTLKLADYREKEGLPQISGFRLPTVQEYEYAAQGLSFKPVYCFGGPESRKRDGQPMLNAKLLRGVYGEGGYYGPAPSGVFNVNGYGLSDMSGNVASWTSTTKTDEKGNSLHIAMGGGWRMLSYFCQIGSSYTNYGEADSAIGIRCVITMPIKKN